MTRNEKRFGVIGTIGNGSELLPILRKEPTHSLHVYESKQAAEEFAIRYSLRDAIAAMRGLENEIKVKPIFREQAPNVYS